MEHVARGQMRLSVCFKFNFRAWQETVSSQNFFIFWTPHHELVVGVFASVKFIEVERQSCSASRCTESDFTETSDFAHHVWRLLIGDHVDFVVAFVG